MQIRIFQRHSLHSHHATAVLLLIAGVWGTTYPLLHTLTQRYPPLSLIALRFVFAVLGMTLILHRPRPKRTRPLARHGWRVALTLGSTLYVAFVTHTIGLQQTTVAHGSLLTGLNVVCMPLLARLLLRQRFRIGTGIGLIITLLGLVLLAGAGRSEGLGDGFHPGDGLVLLCAVAFALHIVLVSKLAQQLPPLELNRAQLSVVAVLAVPTALLHDGLVLPPPTAWAGAAFLGLGATALAFALQLAVQRHTTPTRAACIFALEPVVALGIAAAGGELPSPATVQGGSLLLLGILVAETLPQLHSQSVSATTTAC